MPDKIKDSYNAVKSTGLFVDESDFRTQLKSDPKGVFNLFNSTENTKGLFLDYNDFRNSVGIVEKKNPNTPTASSGTANSTVSKPNPAFKTLDYGEIINKVKKVEGNRAKEIKSTVGGNKNILQKSIDILSETLTSGAAQVLSGAAGLVGGLADLTINKTPEDKQYAIGTNEWLKSKIQQQGEVKNPEWYTNQGVRDYFMGLSTKLNQIASGELGVSKIELGIEPEKSTVDHLINGDITKAGKSLGVETMAMIPQIIGGGITKGSKLFIGAMGAVAAGGSLEKQYGQDKDISITDVSQAAASGLLEYYFERFFNSNNLATGKIIDKVEDLFTPAGVAIKDKIIKEGVDKVKDDLIRGTWDILKEGGKGAAEESLMQEVPLTVLNYVIDSVDENKYNKEEGIQLLKDMGQALVTSAVAGGIPSIVAAKISKIPYSSDEKVKISKYEELLGDSNLSKESKDLISNRLFEIKNIKSNESSKVYDDALKLDIPDRVKVLNELTKISKLENDVKSINDVDLKDEMLAEIERRKQGVSDIINKDFYTFEYSKESDIPSELKDKVSSVSEVNGKKTYRITLPKSQANFILNNLNNSKNSNEAEQAKTQTEAEQTVLDETPEGQLSSSGTPIEQSIETLPSEVGVSQEPQQTTGGEEIAASGVLKAQEAVKPENPEQAWTKSKVMMENQEQMLMDMNKKSSGWNNFVKKWFERQINVVKAMGNSKEAQKAKDQMTVVAGARSAADEKFKNSEKEIYKGLSLEEEKNLDHLLFHRRVIQIDSSYDTKGKDRIKHPMGFNKEDSEMAIEGMKKEIGEEKFNKLSESADKYFQKQNEILQRLKEGELIDEDTYDRLKDDDYIKRVFIDHLNDSPENRTKALGDYGLKPRQIQALDEGSEGLLLMDSRQLLNAAYRSAEQRVFQNRANQALSDVIKIQPDMGKELKVWNNKNTGKPEFEHAQKGHTRVVYFVDGKPRAFQLKDNLYNEWMDMEKRTTELDSWVRTIMGTAVLKNMATGINATFAIGNVPADYLNVIMFTDTYDRTNVFNALQKLARSFASNFAQLSLLNSTGVGSKNFKSLSDDFIKYGGGLEFLTTYGKLDDLVKRDKRYSMIGRAIRGTADTAVKALTFTGEQSERAMRLSVFNEVRNQAVKDAGGRDKITQKQWDDISYMAAAKARRTMDFAKGGLWSKKLDNVSPYLNAAAQGTRVAAEYIYKNPKKFASKWAQISSAVAAVTLYNAMVGDDEDWENIPDYEKNNYFIIFSPQKHINKKGEEVRGYWRIKKTPALAPFLNLSEAGTMAAYNQMTGRNFGAKDETLKREWDAINDALPIPIDPTQLPNKMPPVPKAALSYFANYDFYRKQKLVTGVEEDILPQYQGLSDEKIPAIYKKIGEFSSKMSHDMAISPKKLQKATEMIITNPQTNTILGGAYGILDLMVNKFSDVPENWKNTDQEISTIFGGAKARMYREINPNYKLLQDNSLKKIEKELETKNVVIRNEIRDMIENEKSESDVKTFLKGKEGFSNEEKETLYKYYKNVREDKKLQREIPSFYKLAPLKYWSKGSPEDKARILAINIGIMDPKSEEFRDVLRDMDKMGISVSDRFINGYQEIYRQTLENK